MKYVVVVCYGIEGAKQEHRMMCRNLEAFGVPFQAKMKDLVIKTDKQYIKYISDNQDRQFAMGIIVDEVVIKTDELLFLTDNKPLYRELLLRVVRQTNMVPASFTLCYMLFDED